PRRSNFTSFCKAISGESYIQGRQDIADMIGNRVRVRAREQESDDLLRLPFQDRRSRITGRTEWLTVQTNNNDLALKSIRPGCIVDRNIGIDARNAPSR